MAWQLLVLLPVSLKYWFLDNSLLGGSYHMQSVTIMRPPCLEKNKPCSVALENEMQCGEREDKKYHSGQNNAPTHTHTQMSFSNPQHL